MNCCFVGYFNVFADDILIIYLICRGVSVICVFGFLEKGMMYWGSC